MRVASKLITIPVVVHVVHRTDAENISDAQVKSQIDSLNRDFRVKNTDMSKVPTAWKSLSADANIEFALPSKDPNGKQTSGITRTATTVESFGLDDRSSRARPAVSTPGRPTATSTSGSAISARACSATRSSPAAPRKPTAW